MIIFLCILFAVLTIVFYVLYDGYNNLFGVLFALCVIVISATITFIGNIEDAVNYVKTKPKSKIGTADSEGLFGRPIVEMKDKNGNRIIVKIKVRDFI